VLALLQILNASLAALRNHVNDRGVAPHTKGNWANPEGALDSALVLYVKLAITH